MTVDIAYKLMSLFAGASDPGARQSADRVLSCLPLLTNSHPPNALISFVNHGRIISRGSNLAGLGAVAGATLVLLLVSCGFVPEGVSLSDPRIKPLLDATAAAVDRAALGFTPIPADAQVRWERRPRAAYDQMLHIYGKTSRTIGFRKNGTGFRWISEQEIYRGPHTFDSPDGKLQEQITVTYQSEPGTRHGSPPGQLSIGYSGEDARLRTRRRNLTWADVRPVLREWGL